MDNNNNNKKMSHTKLLISLAASLAASALVIQRILAFSRRFNSHLTIIIEEFPENSSNQLFEAANFYLSTQIAPSVRRIKVSKTEEDEAFAVTAERDDPAIDVYEGVEVRWSLICKPLVESSGSGGSDLRRFYELSFNERHRNKVLEKYLPYVLETAMPSIKEEGKKRRGGQDMPEVVETNRRTWIVSSGGVTTFFNGV